MRIDISGILFLGMAILFGRLSRWSQGHHRSLDADSHRGSASSLPGSNTMGMVGSVLVHWPNHQVSLGKANSVIDALSKSQRGTSNADEEDQGFQKEQKEEEAQCLH